MLILNNSRCILQKNIQVWHYRLSVIDHVSLCSDRDDNDAIMVAHLPDEDGAVQFLLPTDNAPENTTYISLMVNVVNI